MTVLSPVQPLTPDQVESRMANSIRAGLELATVALNRCLVLGLNNVPASELGRGMDEYEFLLEKAAFRAALTALFAASGWRVAWVEPTLAAAPHEWGLVLTAKPKEEA